jgi:hypothetical protein
MRPGLGLLAMTLVLIAAACTGDSAPPSTQAIRTAASTSTTVPATTTTTATPTTTIAPTTTTQARIPAALPIVAEPWEWEKLADVDHLDEVRYNGTYLVYEDPDLGSIVATRGGEIVVRHEPIDDQEWIIQDAELGDRWLAIVENTEAAGADRSRLVVYDLAVGAVSYEEILEEEEGVLSIPHISVSGRTMAIAGTPPNLNCIAILDLVSHQPFDEICTEAPVFFVEIDGPYFGFDTRQPGCSTAWTGALYREDNDLREHTNRECWSNGPVGGDRIAVWFESRPGRGGIDLMLGDGQSGEIVNLGRGDNGTAEVCWNRAFWLSGDNDVRTWDGDSNVRTVFDEEQRAFLLGCVGPWVTFATADAIYTANMFTGSGRDACSIVEPAGAETSAELAATLETWVHDRFDDLPQDLEVSVGGAVGSDGWWVGGGGFSSHLEGAVFSWGPDGDIQVAWSGNADSAYEIRQYMLSILPEAPPALLGCVDIDGYVS